MASLKYVIKFRVHGKRKLLVLWFSMRREYVKREEVSVAGMDSKREKASFSRARFKAPTQLEIHSDVELVSARPHLFPFLLYHLYFAYTSLSLFSIAVMQGKIGLRTVGVSTANDFFFQAYLPFSIARQSRRYDPRCTPRRD